MAGYNSNQSAWPYFPRALPRMVAVPGPSPIPTSNYLDVALPPCDTTYYTNAPIERHFQKTHPWYHPWKVFPYAVSTSLPLCGCNRAAGPQNCLLYDIDHLQQDFHPKDSGLSELKAEHPYQTDYSASVANFTVEVERYGASWALPQLRTTQSDATTWQNAAPAHYEGSPLQTEFPAAETELRNEDPVAYEPGWSHDPASSVMVDDNSILAFQASNKSSNSDVSAQPSADTCDAAGAAPSTRPSVLTQTDRPGTAEALVNTEVAMSDLDYLAEEFMKLQRAKEEWKKKKATLKRTLKKPCSCVQRAQQAELSLLALQYSVCRVHCSRLCSNSQGSQSTTTSKTPRADMAGALQKLESDYNHMRREILTGVPLEQLRPLSVDLTGGSSVPSQINADLAENVQSGQVNLHENASTTEFRETAGNTAPLFCRSPREQQQFLDKEKSSLELKSEDGKQRKVQMVSSTAACNEMSVSEAWFDAEEYLDDFTCGGSHCLPPCVPIFPSNITEIDMKAQLEKHQATDISACSFQSDMRCKHQTTSGQQSLPLQSVPTASTLCGHVEL